MKITFIAILLTLPLLAAADDLVIVGDAWPPYNTSEPSGPKPGYAVEVMKEIFEKKGHTVKYEVVPWTGAVEGVAAGKFTAAICAADGEVKDGVLPKEPISISHSVFYTKKGNPWKYTGLGSLEGKQIGLIKDYSYDKGDFDKWAATAKNVQWSSGVGPLEINLKKMLDGRLDVVMDDPNVVTFTAKQDGLADKIQEAGTLPTTTKLYISFSPKNPKSAEYAKTFSEGLIELRKSGKLKTILASYGLKDWK